MGEWKYGMGEKADRVVGLMEAAMRQYQNGVAGTVLELCKHWTEAERKEFIEIYADGVKKFEKSADGICPLQRVLTGVAFTLRALKEWRDKGPLHGAESDTANVPVRRSKTAPGETP